MTMVERVARAIADAMPETIADFTGPARAAIAAMREPTKQMIDAVSFNAGKYAAEPCTDGTWMIVDLHRSNPVRQGWTDPDAAYDLAGDLGAQDAINSMIDAALKENTNGHL